MKFVACILAAFSCAVSAEESYDGYKVYQVTPERLPQLHALNKLSGGKDYDFWNEPRALGSPLHVMVAPDAQNDFVETASFLALNQTVLIENVERTVQRERFQQSLYARASGGKINFNRYNRYDTIQRYLAELSRNYPDLVSLENIGATSRGRSLNMIKIGAGGGDNPIILMDGGIHAREWISPATVLYIIQQLVENPVNRVLIESTSWYIIPVLNPDGYEYTHTNSRFWRKTRSPGLLCHGVDANRNFDFHWMENGASGSECSETYAGPRGFSEPETQALRDVVLRNTNRIKLYLTFHSYGQYILYPWGYTSELPEDAPELQALAEEVNAAIESFAGTSYTIGSSTNVLYAAAGGSDDWVKGVGGVELAYTLELPGGGSHGFDLPAHKIAGVCEETWKGVLVYQKYIAEKFSKKKNLIFTSE